MLKGSHTRAYTPNHGYFRWGWYHYPRSVSHGSETLRGQGVERQTLPLLGLGWGHSRRTQRAFGTAMRMMRVAVPRRRGPAGLRDPVVRPLMLRFSVSVRKVSAQSPVNATRSSAHLNPSTTQPSSKNRTQRLTRRNVCSLDVAILEVSCYDREAVHLRKSIPFDLCPEIGETLYPEYHAGMNKTTCQAGGFVYAAFR